MSISTKITIDLALVSSLIATQFPQWKDLPIQPVTTSGWDNRTFHLGKQMLIRMPSAADYEPQVEKEHHWLPKLAPLLPLQIPVPIAMGKPTQNYPFTWSIYAWIEGETARAAHINNLDVFAKDLALFLKALQKIDAQGGPLPGQHSFWRGGALAIYDTQMRQAIELLKDKIDTSLATKIWKDALATIWQNPPVWVHGDISPHNLLVKDGRLIAVIDFGQLTTGDPSCDLAIAWNFLDSKSRKVFKETVALDEDTWLRGKAWALWKALIIVANIVDANSAEIKRSWQTIKEIFDDQA